MTLPLPFKVQDSDVQANFDKIAQQFPISALSLGDQWRTSLITTTQSTASASYTTLATPDQVSVTIPTNGLIQVWFLGTWQESIATQGRAAIFIGANQLKRAVIGTAAPVVQEADLGGTAATDAVLTSYPPGLVGGTWGATAYSGDVTTGQAIAIAPDTTDTSTTYGGPCTIFGLPAGTYTISVQLKAISGTVTMKNRHLWVRTIGA